MKSNEDGVDPKLRKRESEFWHAKALDVAISFLPSECPLVTHILTSYQKHHAPVQQEIVSRFVDINLNEAWGCRDQSRDQDHKTDAWDWHLQVSAHSQTRPLACHIDCTSAIESEQLLLHIFDSKGRIFPSSSPKAIQQLTVKRFNIDKPSWRKQRSSQQ